MSTVKVKHPIAGDIDVPLEAFKDAETFNAYLLQNAPDKEYSTADVMGSQFKSGMSSSFRGITDFFTDDSQRTDTEVQDRYLSEFEDRLELEQNPVAAWSGLIAGSIADPVTLPVAFLKPLKVASTVGTNVLRGAAQGAFGGVVEPVYEEFGDSRLANVAGGAAVGTALGGIVGKLLSRNDANAEALANISTDSEKMIDEVAADIAKAEEADVQVVKQQIKDNDEMLPDFLPQKEARQLSIWETRSELEKDIPFLMTKAEEAKTRGQVTIADQQLATKQAEVDNLRKAMSGRQGQARKRVESMYDRASAELEQARIYRDELSNKIDRHVKAIKSEADIAALNKGEIPKHLKQRIDADVKANEAARAEYKEKVKKQRLIKETETPTEKMESTQAKQEAEVQRQQEVAQEEGLPTGLDTPQTSASAAATRPSAIYNPEATEGVDLDALTKAETTTQLEGVQPARGRGFEEGTTTNQQKRETLRQVASEEQIAKMSPTGGKYTFEEVAKAAQRLRDELGSDRDYDSLVDYLIKRVDDIKGGKGVLSSVEIDMLQPVFDEAEARLIKTGIELRSLKRKNMLDSYEGLKAMQDLQLYNYLSNIDLANRSAVSAALRQYSRMKNIRKTHAASVAKGKPVNNLFVDSNGRSIC